MGLDEFTEIPLLEKISNTFVILLLVSPLLFAGYAISTRCPKCGKFFATHTVDVVEKGRREYDATRDEGEIKVNSSGMYQRVETQVDVHVTERDLLVTHQCKYCAHTWQTREQGVSEEERHPFLEFLWSKFK